jgi:hypothetical protein
MMFRSFKEEGIWDARILRAYYDAFYGFFERDGICMVGAGESESGQLRGA